MSILNNRIIAGSVLAIAAVAGAIGTGSVASATTSTNSCINGSNRSSFVTTWTGKSSLTVKTKNNAPLCNDVTLYFSSYTLPKNYDGTGFGGPTSYPQQIFASTHQVFAKGSNGPLTFAVDSPAKCENIQVDLYYGPEIKVVTSSGHGSQYIDGKLYKKEVDTCETPVVETPVTPETPTTPEAEIPVTETPAPVAETVELPHTGAGLSGVVTAFTLAAFTYVGVLLVRK